MLHKLRSTYISEGQADRLLRGYQNPSRYLPAIGDEQSLELLHLQTTQRINTSMKTSMAVITTPADVYFSSTSSLIGPGSQPSCRIWSIAFRVTPPFECGGGARLDFSIEGTGKMTPKLPYPTTYPSPTGYLLPLEHKPLLRKSWLLQRPHQPYPSTQERRLINFEGGSKTAKANKDNLSSPSEEVKSHTTPWAQSSTKPS